MADDPDSVLAMLDPEQQEVALATRGPVCVLAGAGTGKTRAIAHRIAYAVRVGVADPAHVLALTFTVRAAAELRARLRQLGGPGGGGMELVQAHTFHAAALRQLRHFWPAAVGGPPPAVLDSKVALLAEAARALRVRASQPELRDVAAEIEWSKVMQLQPDDYPAAAGRAARTAPLPPEVIARLFAAYERLRRERHLVDFESVLELTAALLAGHAPAGAEVADRYRNFVVDEYQDLSPLQKLLLDTWVGGRDELCVVGDPRQTIYSFTGATPAYLTGFTAEYPHARVIELVRNYRSTPQVVALANQLTGTAGRRNAAPGPGGPREGPPLVAQRPAGPEPEYTEYGDDAAEAASVAARARLLIGGGVPPRDIAVLVRVNAQTERFERALAAAGVPYRVRGMQRFFDRPEVRQALAALRAATKSARGPAGAGHAARVRAGPGEPTPVPDVGHVLAGFGLTREPPAGRGSSRDRWESMTALAQLAEDFCEATPGAGFADVVAELGRLAAAGDAPDEGVTVSSLHAAKGLEWDAVFLPGLTEGNLPIAHAQTAEAVAEEGRLLYVGVTRARQRLFLSWSLARSPGGRQTRTRSRFLDGLWPQYRPGMPAALAERLRGWRSAMARGQGVPAHVVLTDEVLWRIARERPASGADLARIPGVGPAGMDRYGAAVLALCAEAAAGEDAMGAGMRAVTESMS